jgi:hypothetical protein
VVSSGGGRVAKRNSLDSYLCNSRNDNRSLIIFVAFIVVNNNGVVIIVLCQLHICAGAVFVGLNSRGKYHADYSFRDNLDFFLL